MMTTSEMIKPCLTVVLSRFIIQQLTRNAIYLQKIVPFLINEWLYNLQQFKQAEI